MWKSQNALNNAVETLFAFFPQERWTAQYRQQPNSIVKFYKTWKTMKPSIQQEVRRSDVNFQKGWSQRKNYVNAQCGTLGVRRLNPKVPRRAPTSIFLPIFLFYLRYGLPKRMDCLSLKTDFFSNVNELPNLSKIVLNVLKFRL